MDNENKRKHLEFIQLTITRMNVNSFLVKGWLVTLTAAIFVLAQKDTNAKFFWIMPLISILFWILDGFFVRTERQYRGLYDYVRSLEASQVDFSMNTELYKGGKNTYFRCFLSITLILFYPIITIFSIFATAYFNS